MTGQQQLKHRAKPMCGGNCHHGCLTGNVCGPRGTRPFVEALRPEVDVRMRLECQECMVRSGDYTGNPTDSRACAEHPNDPRKWGVASLERVTWESCSKHDLNTNTYEPHNSTYRYNIIKYNLNLIDKYIKMFSATSGSHWHNLKLNIFTYLNKYT